MQNIKRAFRDIGSLIRGRGSDSSKMRDLRADNLCERLAGSKRESRPLTSADLAAGITAGELFLEYQPKLDWRLGRITGIEALLRWRHPTRGILQPNQFIALAVETSLIRRLTDWVIASAATQTMQWHADNLPLEVAVNLSVRDVEDVDLPDRVERHCQNAALNPAFLTLELPEPGATCEVAQMTDVLTRLHLKGVNLSINDFGRCYSSLVQLQKVPLSEVKVNLTFVKQMTSNADCRFIVETLIDLAHKLGLKCVAEGVEDDDVLKTLIELGCDDLQGYYISRPIPAGLIPAFVRDFESHAGGGGPSDPQICAQARCAVRDVLDGPDLAAPPEMLQLDAAE